MSRIRVTLVSMGLAALLNQTVLAASLSNSLWLGNDSFVESGATLYFTTSTEPAPFCSRSRPHR